MARYFGALLQALFAVKAAMCANACATAGHSEDFYGFLTDANQHEQKALAIWNKEGRAD